MVRLEGRDIFSYSGEIADIYASEIAEAGNCCEFFVGWADPPPGKFEDLMHRIPLSLKDALRTPSDYAMGLQEGTVIRFTEAFLCGEWAHLQVKYSDGVTTKNEASDSFNFRRGIDVRLSDIVWCCDEPESS